MNELEPVLKFIYLGQCEAYPADFEGFIETARLLGVAGLDDTPIGNSKDKLIIFNQKVVLPRMLTQKRILQ